MMQFLKSIANAYRVATMNPVDRYLSQASDLADLEHRMKTVKRGGMWSSNVWSY